MRRHSDHLLQTVHRILRRLSHDKWLTSGAAVASIENIIVSRCLQLVNPPENYMFDFFNKTLSGTLNNRIKFVNADTGASTLVENETQSLDAGVDLPDGLGIFKPLINEELKNGAELDIINLFMKPSNYETMNPYTVKTDVVALFWPDRESPPATLRSMLQKLDSGSYSDLVNVLRVIYIPMLQEILQIDTNAVLDASSEIIYYKKGADSGLEQHIDNVSRTNGELGPVCSIPLVSERSYDLFPCLVNKPIVFRVRTEPGDLFIMDSDARVRWSHAVPYGDASHDRYSIIIRPLKTRTADEKPLFTDDTLDVAVYSPTVSLINSKSEEWQQSKPRRATQSRRRGAQTIDTNLIDFPMKKFWKDKGCVSDFMKTQGFGTSAWEMPAGMIRNEKWIDDFFKGVQNLTIVEPYGHDGADTLSFMFSFGEDASVVSTSTHNRIRNLTTNLSNFKRNKLAGSYMISNTITDLFGYVNTTPVSMLYIDPPWKISKPGSREYTPEEMIYFIQTNVLSKLTRVATIQHICFKVRYDWDAFQEILSGNIMKFHHTQTIAVRSARSGNKHHFHTVSVSPKALNVYNHES